MNTKVLKEAEKKFLKRYPGGFKHPDMAAIGKKHKMGQMVELVQTSFAKKNFKDPEFITSEMVKVVSRSSMISLFEKPKFRDMIKSLQKNEKKMFSKAVYELLHGQEKKGFEFLISELGKRRLAKWTLATVIQAYYRPNKEVLIKPTTVKLIIDKLDFELVYKPTPTWEFYRKYRKKINEVKTKANKNLTPNNAAFCGFLMMGLGDCPR